MWQKPYFSLCLNGTPGLWLDAACRELERVICFVLNPSYQW